MASEKWSNPTVCLVPMSWPTEYAWHLDVRTTSIYPLPKMSPDRALGLRDVPWADYDLQGLRYHREDGGLIPYDLSVDGELQAPRARLDPDLLRPGKEDPFFVQVVRSSKNRGGELEHLLHRDVFYDHEVKEPVLGVGPRRREPTATGVAAVADR